jgi:hypothetical protein
MPCAREVRSSTCSGVAEVGMATRMCESSYSSFTSGAFFDFAAHCSISRGAT